MLRYLRIPAGAPLRAKARRQAARAMAAAADCRLAQRQTRDRILSLNQDSRFHGPRGLRGGMSTADFRAAIGICTYEDFRAAIDEVRGGDHAAFLGPGNRLLMFALSSGTTDASKYIPITGPFLSDYRRGWQVWGIQALDARPASHVGHFFQIASDFDKFRTPAGVPCGNISGLVQSIQSPVVRTMYSVPPSVMKITDPDAKYYTALRYGVADRNVAVAMTANPSTLVRLAEIVQERSEELIRDLHDGTLAVRDEIPSALWSRYGRSFARRRRRRARQLEAAAKRGGGLRPADFWPRLETLAVWTGGSCAAYLGPLRRVFPGIAIRDHGLSASEGRMTIPVADETPSGVLDVLSHYFEFIPEAEIESSTPTVLEAHELVVGQNYFILMTTPSGLLRYDIHDVVRCTGHHGTPGEGAPMLEFLHKGAYIASITGEKVTESQVVRVVAEALGASTQTVLNFTLCPEWGDPPGYRLLFEESVAAAFGEAVVDGIDRRLKDVNEEYQEKRDTGRLAAIRPLPLPAGTWRKFMADRQSGPGGSAEQYKHPCLQPSLEFLPAFRERYLERPARAREEAPKPT